MDCEIVMAHIKEIELIPIFMPFRHNVKETMKKGEGGLGMGCTPWQVVWNITLPSATPGIMTGSILAMSRAMGEAAPILLVSSALYVSSVPSSLMSRYTIMPLQIYQWADDHNREFYSLAATGIIVLLAVLLSFNAVAVIVRQRAQRSLD